MARRSKLPVPPRPNTDTLLEAWGTPVRQDLLELALIHRSYANEAGGIAHNERLEFLGDSVLSIVVADELYHRHGDVPESELSRMRAATVSQEPLAQAARHIELGEYIYLG
ncbi:MAG: ribonuclease III domain-containing protein, partial [Actinomyces sp.]|nr:ribonuclease III domain-containing protein [Actinomyces sp.]